MKNCKHDNNDDSFSYFRTPPFECGAGTPVGSSEEWSEDNLDAHVGRRIQHNSEVQPNMELRRRNNPMSSGVHHDGGIALDTNDNICNRQLSKMCIKDDIKAFNSQMPSKIEERLTEDAETPPKEYVSGITNEREDQAALLDVEYPKQMQLYRKGWLASK